MSDYVDQDAMTEDFFEGHELVFQESGEPAAVIESTNAKNAETNTEVNFSESENTEEPIINQSNEKNNVENAPADPFAFLDTSGESPVFNPSAAMEFFNAAQSAPKQEQFSAELPPITPEAPAQNGNITETQLSYKESIEILNNRAFDLINEFIKNGADPQTAIYYAKNAVTQELNDHLREKELKDMEARMLSQFEDKKQAKTAEMELMELRPKSTKNLYEVAKHSGYKSVEELQQALTNPAYGGNFLYYQFKTAMGNRVFKSEAERSEALNNWFIKFTSDKQALQFAESYTRSQIFNKQFPEMVKYIRGNAQRAVKENTSAKSMGPVSRQTTVRKNPATASKDPLADYLSGGGIDEV